MPHGYLSWLSGLPLPSEKGSSIAQFRASLVKKALGDKRVNNILAVLIVKRLGARGALVATSVSVPNATSNGKVTAT